MRIWVILRLLVCLWLLIAGSGAWAQPAASSLPPGEAFALEFRDHVVRVRTRWASGGAQDGFGFVVGQNASGVYIATANHVVRGAGPGETAEQIMLTWFRRSGEEFPATLIGTSDERRDLAVLRADLPEGPALRPDLMRHPSAIIGRSTPVWYVGREREWYVPSQPGTVNSIDLDDLFRIDGLNVQVGTSGAPLITDGGVAGMIIRDSIGGVVEATDIGFIGRAFAQWNHPWDLEASVGDQSPASAPGEGAGGQTGSALPEETQRIGSAVTAPLAPTAQPLIGPAGRDMKSQGAVPDPDALRHVLSAFGTSAPGSGTALGGALTLRDVHVGGPGPAGLEVGVSVGLEGIDLGRVTGWVSPGETPRTFEVLLEPQSGAWKLELDGCDVNLVSRDVSLVWDEALRTFSSAKLELGPSAISCPDADFTVRRAAFDLVFERSAGDVWDGWVDVSVEGLSVRTCSDIAEICGPARAAGFDWPWQSPMEIDEGRLLVSLDGADLAERMVAFESAPPGSWPRHAAFSTPLLDPLAAAAGLLEPAWVADYLGVVSASLSMHGLTFKVEGTAVTIDGGEAEFVTGRPARLAYDVSGLAMTAGAPSAARSSAQVEIETTGRLDAATLLGGGLQALTDASPFEIWARAESAAGRLEGTGTVAVDLLGEPSLVAAKATVTTDNPVGYLLEVLLGPMAAGLSDPAAFERALADVLAAQGWLPPQPGRDPDYAIRYDPLSESVVVEGRDLSGLLQALDEACLRHGC